MYNKYSAYNEQNVQEVKQVRRVQSKWIDESLSFTNLALDLGSKSFFATFLIRALNSNDVIAENVVHNWA